MLYGSSLLKIFSRVTELSQTNQMHAKNIATCLFPTFFSDIFAGQFSAETFTTDSGIYIDILVILIGKLKPKVDISIRAEYYGESRLHPRLDSPLYSALI